MKRAVVCLLYIVLFCEAFFIDNGGCCFDFVSACVVYVGSCSEKVNKVAGGNCAQEKDILSVLVGS